MAEIDTAPAVDEGTATASDLMSWLRPSFDESEVSEGEPDEAEEVEADEPDEESDADTETEESEPETETEAPKALDEMSDDELSEHPKVKSLIARKGESTRQTTERETAARLYAQQQQYAASTQVRDDLVDLVAKAQLDDNGNPKIATEQVDRITGALLQRGVGYTVDVMASVLNELTGPDFKMTEKESELVQGGLSRYHQNPNDPSPLIRAWLDPLKRHLLDSERTALKAEWEKEWKAEQEAAGKALSAKTAAEARKGKSPTGVNGQPVKTKNEWDAANAGLSGSLSDGLKTLRDLGVSV